MSSVYERLPDRPDHPFYREQIAEIDNLLSRPASASRGYARLAALAESDFWAHMRFVSSMRHFRISDREHRSFGGLWVDEPWLFDRSREAQEDIETGAENRKFYNWPRGHMKSTVHTCHKNIWLIIKDPQLTIGLICWKLEDLGAGLFRQIRTELLENPFYHLCWPHIFPETPADYPLLSTTQLTVLRAPGPKEPTVSVHALMAMPTSFHMGRINCDDLVVKETVRTKRMMDISFSAIQDLTPLRSLSGTPVNYEGTRWDINDPYGQMEASGMFSSVDRWNPWSTDPEDVRMNGKRVLDHGVLLSQSGLQQWRDDMGEYVFSCQMLNRPTPKGKRTFLDEWLHWYMPRPTDEKEGKYVYAIFDFATTGEDRVAGFYFATGADGKMVALDLFREDCGLNKAFDLIFRTHPLWKPRCLFVEEYGESGRLEILQREMEIRGYRFTARRLPKVISRTKEQRIENLGPFLERQELLFPFNGFGHGSEDDGRDTLDQFRQDEYSYWTPLKDSTATDDMLDVVAWAVQPEVQALLDYPQAEEWETEDERWHGSRETASVPSWRVA